MFKTALAYETWKNKYRYGNETPLETFQRVAKALASVEKNPDEWYDKFLHTMVKFNDQKEAVGLKCTAGGRITANIGTTYKKATLVNCFIGSPVSNATIKYTKKSDYGHITYPVKYESDESPDDLINIFLTIMEQAKTLASEGGYGLNFDFIRPRGSLIKGTGIKHPGVVAYMKIWDSVSECIVQGDTDGYVDKIKNHLVTEEKFQEVKRIVKDSIRKGAMLAALSCSHPDFEEFIRAKQKSGVLTKFNMSVILDDTFMKAVEEDGLYEQSFNGKTFKMVKARELYDLIMQSNYNRAEPGVLFCDNMMKNNPVAYLGKLSCVNPCLHGSSLLLTKGGLRKIEDLSGHCTTIWNGTEWSESRISFTGVKPVYEMVMSNGLILKATEDHVVECFKKKLTMEIPVISSSGKQVTRLTGSPWEGTCIDFSNEVLQCLGFAFGDSNFHKASGRFKYVHIGKDDKEIEVLFNIIGEELPEESRYDKRCLSVDFADKCVALHFPPVPLPERSLSDKIFTLPPDQICQFLKGLFSANGSVLEHYGRITFKSTCRELLGQLQIILASLGMKAYITTNKSKSIEFSNGIYECRESYDLNISSTDVPIFRDKIGFIQQYKKDKLDALMGWKYGRRVEPYVVSVSYLGEEKVYDFTESKTHWGFVNGLKVHNCGEIPGLSSITTVCLLGSPNLTQYVKKGPDGEPEFDFEEYSEDIKVFMRMLDNVNDLTYAPLPSYQWVIENLRQVGMGINALGSTLMMLKIPYNSNKAVAFAEKVSRIKEDLTWQTSALLAHEKGTFSAYDKKLFESTEYFKSDRISPVTKALIEKYGVRNAKTTTCPPLGNSSIIADMTSNGVEPVFKLGYERKVICKEWPEGLTEENVREHLKHHKEKDFEFWRGSYKDKVYYYEPHNRGLCEVNVVRDYGYQWLLDNYPELTNAEMAPYLVTTDGLTIEDHLAVQKVVQYYNNQSVSKTCNLPKKFPFEDFKQLYVRAWKSGLNGFTTYREGSMESVLSDISKIQKREIIKRDIKLPEVFINGPTHIVKKEGKKFYINFSYLPEDSKLEFPIVLWIHTNARYKADELRICNKAAKNLGTLALKCSIDRRIVTETIEKATDDYPHNRLGRMVSLCLRHNVPREDILMSLEGIDGDNLSTLLAAVRKFLSKTLPDGTKLPGLKCPSCGEQLVVRSGCKDCPSCGWTAC